MLGVAPGLAMAETQLLAIIAGLLGVLAAALIVFMVVAAFAIRDLRAQLDRLTAFADTWEPVAADVRKTLAEISGQSVGLLTRLDSLAALLHRQARRTESVVEDLAGAARRNIDQVDSTVRRTLEQIEQISDALHRIVTGPAAKLRAVATGFSAAFREFSRGSQPRPDRVSTDEEMFI